MYHGKLMLYDFVTALSGLTVLLSVSLLFVPSFNRKTMKDSIAGFRCAAGTQWHVYTETLFSSLVPRDEALDSMVVAFFSGIFNCFCNTL